MFPLKDLTSLFV